jgi:hypothetical protein
VLCEDHRASLTMVEIAAITAHELCTADHRMATRVVPQNASLESTKTASEMRV